jgi:hypothetical protein
MISLLQNVVGDVASAAILAPAAAPFVMVATKLVAHFSPRFRRAYLVAFLGMLVAGLLGRAAVWLIDSPEPGVGSSVSVNFAYGLTFLPDNFVVAGLTVLANSTIVWHFLRQSAPGRISPRKALLVSFIAYVAMDLTMRAIAAFWQPTI